MNNSFEKWLAFKKEYYSGMSLTEYGQGGFDLFQQVIEQYESSKASQEAKPSPVLRWVKASEIEPPLGRYPVRYWKGKYGSAEYFGHGDWGEDHSGTISVDELEYLSESPSTGDAVEPQQDAFVVWLDKEIKDYARLAANERGNQSYLFDGRRREAVAAKEKFLSLHAPSEEDRRKTISELEQVFKDKAAFIDDWTDYAHIAYDFFHGLISSSPSAPLHKEAVRDISAEMFKDAKPADPDMMAVADKTLKRLSKKAEAVEANQPAGAINTELILKTQLEVIGGYIGKIDLNKWTLGDVRDSLWKDWEYLQQEFGLLHANKMLTPPPSDKPVEGVKDGSEAYDKWLDTPGLIESVENWEGKYHRAEEEIASLKEANANYKAAGEQLMQEIITLRESGRLSMEQHQQIERELRGQITDLIAEVVGNSEEADEYRTALKEAEGYLQSCMARGITAKNYKRLALQTIENALNKFTNNKENDR